MRRKSCVNNDPMRRLAAISSLALPLLLATVFSSASGASASEEGLLDDLTAPVELRAPSPRAEGDDTAGTNAVIFKPGNIAGTWHFHIWLHGSPPLWLACDAVKLRATGRVVTGSKCKILDIAGGRILQGTVSGGRLQLASNGKITGKLVVGTGDIPVVDAWMDKKKSFFQGVGVSLGRAMELSAVKR